MPPYTNTRSSSKRKIETIDNQIKELTNLDGTPHWCPSWCKCCEEALERAKSSVKHNN